MNQYDEIPSKTHTRSKYKGNRDLYNIYSNFEEFLKAKKEHDIINKIVSATCKICGHKINCITRHNFTFEGAELQCDIEKNDQIKYQFSELLEHHYNAHVVNKEIYESQRI